MSYIQRNGHRGVGGVALDGFFGDLLSGAKNAGGVALDLMKKGAAGGGGGEPAPAYEPPSFMDQYGTVLLLGGAGAIAYLVLRKKK